MPILEQAPARIDKLKLSQAIDAIDKNLAGSALYLTIEDPYSPQTVATLSADPGVLKSHVDTKNDISWQLWQNHEIAEQSYGNKTDLAISAHYSVIRGVDRADDVVFVPHTAEGGAQ